MQLPIGPCPSPPTPHRPAHRVHSPLEKHAGGGSSQKRMSSRNRYRKHLPELKSHDLLCDLSKHFFLSFVLTLPPSTFKYISDTMGFNGYIHIDETWIMPFLHLSWLKSHDLSSTLCTEVDPMPSDILVTFLQTSPKVQTWFSKGALMPWEQRQVQPKWGH